MVQDKELYGTNGLTDFNYTHLYFKRHFYNPTLRTIQILPACTVVGESPGNGPKAGAAFLQYELGMGQPKDLVHSC